MTMRWSGVEDVERGMDDYGDKVMIAVRQVADYFARVIETYAKENASWTDQTGNARQALHGWTEDLAEDTVALYLSHGVFYGLFLEVRWAGKYGIIWEAIETHLPQIRAMLQGIFD